MNYSAFRTVAHTWTKALASTVAVSMILTSFVGVSFFINPTAAHAATDLITNGDFGIGDDQLDIPNWEEKGNENAESTIAKKPTSGNESASPNGGRFARMGKFNSGQDGGGSICQQIDASEYENLSLSYYWRGDDDAENTGSAQDYGYVEYLTTGNCETADNQWANLKTYEDIRDNGWKLDSVDLSGLDGITFYIRFRAHLTSNSEHWRVDGVSLTGDEVVEVPSCDLTSEHPGFTTFDTFSLGDVDGQNNWSSTGSFDQAVVENVYGYASFGCKSLRLSNAVTSESFGDQTFAAPTPNTAGEAGDVNHYEAQFDIASTQTDEQSGLAVSVSPDDGNGSRMSYLSFADEAGGIRVTFYDTTNPGPLPSTTVWNPTDLGLLDRNTPHTIKFVIDFVDGPANDVVKIYIDGGLVHAGTTWEDYYRYDSEQNGNGNQLFPIDTLIFRVAGTATPATDGEGYLFDNLSITTENIQPEPEPEQCSVAIYSDTTNTVTEKSGAFAKLLTFVHANWADEFDLAEWIWGDDPVANPSQTETQTFVKTFEWSGPIDTALLTFAADNYYTVTLNGNEVASEQVDPANFGSTIQLDVADDLVEGVNTLEIEVTNKAGDSDPKKNPAGLLYSLVVTSTEDGDACQTAPEPIENSCALPHADAEAGNIDLGSSNEQTLQSILVEKGYSLDADTDQENYETWAPDGMSVSFTATFLRSIAGDDLVFGYYLNGDLNTFVPLFEKGDHSDFPALSPASEGDTESFTIPVFDSIGFAIHTEQGETTRVYATESALNDDGDHAVVYNPEDNTYVIAFEDRPLAGADKDHNDMVVEVVVDRCDGFPVCEFDTELLTNGDFEYPVVAGNPLWNIFDSAPHTAGLGWFVEWLTNDDSAPEIAHLEIQRDGLSGWSATSTGAQWTELDSDWQGPGGASGEEGSVAISQSIFTEVGETYTFSFDFSARPNTPAAQNKVEVLVNDSVLYTAGPTAGGSNTSWTHHSFSFVADSLLTTITLRDAGTPNDSLGTFIDNASFMCVEPEPVDPWCSYEGEVIDYSDPAYKNSGAPVDANRRDVSGIENGPASYTNFGGKESSWSTDDFFSLGINGWLIYEFTGQVAYDQTGDDIAIYEITGGTSGQTQEKVEVLVSQNGINFYSLGTYTGDASVDIAPAGLDFVKYVKLVDDSAGIQGSGGDGYDVDAIVILNGSCAEDPGPQFATVTLCKYDTDENSLGGWGLSLLGDSVGSFEVDSGDQSGTDSPSLTAGTPYVALVGGTFFNSGGNGGSGNYADAEFVSNDSAWTSPTDGPGVKPNNLDLQVNNQFVNWGPYNSAHEYAHAFTVGANGAVNFRVFDGNTDTNTPTSGWYGDNSGSLSVDLYQGYAGVTDEQTGCVVFEQVPLGTYTVGELAQQGWQNVSGLGSVTVDESQEIFDVVNVELDTITVEKWSDEDQDGSWDENENGISGWDIVVKPETLTPVNEFTVDSSSQTGTDSTVLTDGRVYLVEVSGTYQYAGNSSKVADAGFYSTNNWSTYGEWGTDNPTEDQRTLNLIVDDAEINWGTYNADHLYKALVTGADAAVNFRIFERVSGHYPDNTGDITVRIFDVTDYMVTTGEDGSTTLEVLPGEYQVVEMQREGWVQTAPTGPSYCHINTTDESNHTCTFGNYETPEAPETATLVATKIVCDAEEYLPNWGTGQYGPITETTATDWLAEGDNSEYCHLESGWEFQWAQNSDTSTNPGDEAGEQSSPFTTFGLTDVNGEVSTTIPAGERVWVREILKDGYIGFAGQTTQDNDSAELYCSTDVLNYDNWEWIDPVNADETYYCVAWNAPVPGAPELTIVKYSYDGEVSVDGDFDFSVTDSGDVYNLNETPTIETVDGEGDTTLQLPGEGTFTIAELLSGDWLLDNVICENAALDEVGLAGQNDDYEITVEDGDEITCYFTNVTNCEDGEYYDEKDKQCKGLEGGTVFDIEVVKAVDHDGSPAVGEEVTYTITATNLGSYTTNELVIHDLLPTGVTYVPTYTTNNGTYDYVSGDWELSSLANGGVATLTIVATINSGQEGNTIVNTAELTDDGENGTDTDENNNSDSASFTVEDEEENGGGGGSNPEPQTILGGGITGLGGGGGLVLGASTSNGQVLGESCGLYMDQFLRRGYAGNNTEQVMKLQEFLNKHGFGALDVTGIFGLNTETAVKSFQQAYADQILTPWGLTEPTGLVYITTLRQINLVECPHLSLQIPELVAWSLANGSSVADSLTGNGTQTNGDDTGGESEEGGSDDTGSSDQAAAAGGAVKGQGFWGRVWNFFFGR